MADPGSIPGGSTMSFLNLPLLNGTVLPMPVSVPVMKSVCFIRHHQSGNIGEKPAVNNLRTKGNMLSFYSMFTCVLMHKARLSERPVKTAIEGTAGASLQANLIVPQIF